MRKLEAQHWMKMNHFETLDDDVIDEMKSTHQEMKPSILTIKIPLTFDVNWIFRWSSD